MLKDIVDARPYLKSSILQGRLKFLKFWKWRSRNKVLIKKQGKILKASDTFTEGSRDDENLYKIKNIRKLIWMSHGVMCFWFLLNLPFISAFFDILASLSISAFFKRLFRPMKILLLRHPQNNYQIWLYNLNLTRE